MDFLSKIKTVEIVMGDKLMPKPQTITIDDNLHNLREIQKYAHHKIRRGIYNQLYFHGIDKQHTPNLAIFTLNNKQYGPGKFAVKYFFSRSIKIHRTSNIFTD